MAADRCGVRAPSDRRAEAHTTALQTAAGPGATVAGPGLRVPADPAGNAEPLGGSASAACC
ncbi:hypothetical protein QJS66_01170 [Kocuria rhizophila]|nr:hypothetical protein QJS66_01170 [Kocuria rhizophila]